jgi:hypothetical protein
VPVFVRLTWTPGTTAPLASVTVPLMLAVFAWPKMREVVVAIEKETSKNATRRFWEAIITEFISQTLTVKKKRATIFAL